MPLKPAAFLGIRNAPGLSWSGTAVEPTGHSALLLDSRPLRYRPTVTPTDEDEGNLTDEHMRLLEWLDGHPGASLQLAARDLGLGQVEALCADLVAAGMIERMRLQ